jgi:type III secretion protein U
MSDDKTEEPTEQKLQEARRKGQSPKSQDLNVAAGLLTATLCLSAAAPVAADHLRRLFAHAFDAGLLVRSDAQMQAQAFDLAIEGLWVVLPFVATAVLTGFVASFAQVGLNISFDSISPKFDKLNPAEGVKKLMSLKNLLELGKSVLKALLVGAVVYQVSMGLVPLLVSAGTQTPLGIVQVAWSSLLQLLCAVLVVYAVIGPADFALQKWQFVKERRMSKDEIKREYKQNEGDPMLKGQRKRLAHEIANSAPKSRVPRATVVVTNPTHYAVALRYVAGETPLPIIVAKGAGAEAAFIRQIATAAGVPLVGNPPLARALFKQPLDAPVPEELFEAVVALLRWVGTLDRVRDDANAAASANANTAANR